MTDREVMQQALVALEKSQAYVEASSNKKLKAGLGAQLDRAEDAINAIREALAAPQPAQELVSWPAGSAQLHTSLLDMGKAMAKERSREIGDAWNQLADLLYLLSKARNTPQAPQPAPDWSQIEKITEAAELRRLAAANAELLEALINLLRHAERANEIMLHEAGIGVCDVTSIAAASAAIAKHGGAA